MKDSRTKMIRQPDNRNAICILDTCQKQAGEPNMQVSFNSGFANDGRKAGQYFNALSGIVIANSLQLLAVDRHLLSSIIPRRIRLCDLLEFES